MNTRPNHQQARATVAGLVFQAALMLGLFTVLALATPVNNPLWQGAATSDLNQGGHNITNVGTLQATNLAGAATNQFDTNGAALNALTNATAIATNLATAAQANAITASTNFAATNTAAALTTATNFASTNNVAISRLPTGTTSSTVALGNAPAAAQAAAISAAEAFSANASNLSSGTVPAAQLPIGTTAGTVASGNDSRFGAGSATLPQAHVAYVDASGNDSTGTVGTSTVAAKPFATAQAAYNALAAGGPGLLKLGVGGFGGWVINLTADWGTAISISGTGAGNCELTISTAGHNFEPPPLDGTVELNVNTQPPNDSQAAGGTIIVTGAGAGSYFTATGADTYIDGNVGGNGGSITLTNCLGQATAIGGSDYSPTGANNPGNGGTITTTGCSLSYCSVATGNMEIAYDGSSPGTIFSILTSFTNIDFSNNSGGYGGSNGTWIAENCYATSGEGSPNIDALNYTLSPF